MKINFNRREPVYVQVIRYFKQQIATNMFEPGQEIPSRRELAGEIKINPNTVQRAYKEMEEQGLIYTEGNLPSKITRDEQVLKAVREELIMDAVDEFVATVQSVHVPFEEIVTLLQEKYEQASEDKEEEQ
ncbi:MULTISPECIES: GntR family transcriptional regulator [Virgibacillus]|uniref:GntR family transcriptional regulator n=1 Tax=Virgibacillus pantothenticus TaxID=1473 RepID=A0A0L0QK58_VIRPA|nr:MULTISPECIES: GntR family transcriptional regulator [Virgibacillus]API92861.1 GntR family transcriptional regulator [Virgibacillus sp. 6R]KNE18904.1 GntR family transcriptional regulator [Virgibacillus pantothenticus]MBS7428373.1 GntR family transcriptional regulator [Virgibacillus sp. 19R1-5]MBU8565193.1 GntR family transcriptional regulator [Virgibacillus pantothenticus]MBU8601477.1 GntR family transcriptional regulator [Virgibacillus pantothenticus]